MEVLSALSWWAVFVLPKIGISRGYATARGFPPANASPSKPPSSPSFRTAPSRSISAERTAVQIDQWGVAKALQDAYIEVFRALHAPDCQIIVDGDLHFDGLGLDDLNIQAIIKADSKFPTVMAASILAKTYRDGKMIQLAQQYPVYDWEHNMGYGSPKHLSAITQHGISPLHRLSYAPMKNMKQPK